MKKHISVLQSGMIWVIGTAIAIAGAAIVGWQLMQHSPSIWFIYGVMTLSAGLVVVILNQVVFDVRRTQLEIDYREGIRDQIGNVCPNCGQRLPQNSMFCNACGKKV